MTSVGKMAQINILLCLAVFGACVFASDVEIPIDGGKRLITDEEQLTALRGNIAEHLEKLGAEEDGPQLELIKIHSATIQAVAGVLSEAFITVAENAKESNCSISLWEKSWENFIKFEVECDENKKYEWTTGEVKKETATTDANVIQEIPMPLIIGGKSPITDEKGLAILKENITEHLKKLGAQENGPQLELVKIHSATFQVVAGYIRDAFITVNENANEANCSISLWEKSWEKFIKFDVECDGNKKYVWTTGEVKEEPSLPDVTVIQDAQMPLLTFGGKTPITSETGLAILKENITKHLKNLGTQENGPQLELVKIHEATYQVVAGSISEAFITVTENTKEANCSTKLYERSWEDYIKFEVDCGEDKKYLWIQGPHEQRRKRSPQGFGYAGTPLSQIEIDEFSKKLDAALKEWANSHSDFDVTLKNIWSGKTQPRDPDTYYTLHIQTFDKTGQISEWQTEAFVKSDGSFRSVTLTIPHQKQHRLTFE